ncbi:Asparaginyl-tRNA synthetase [Spirochaeta thermophila DSM 6578]|uniref:Asparagine--tRNA ligase n=1 Tax=Winmispira thermophila (strain ATCC 700085 / DSM 6578 / Z-1203) TaxID=869211 RepID=G0GF79_WINT7|nr:asparagine--tRNA ligase [Spirochaeta thermophila]AEJ60778.1 Asparaginyl-tRNA synthetase [Spirochaeta thermophila DSM 6578]
MDIIRQRIQDFFSTPPEGQKVEVLGWVRSVRESKQVAFLHLSDGSTTAPLQVVVDKTREELASCLETLRTGASVRVVGTLRPSPGTKQPVEIHAEALTVLGPAPEDYPLQKKRHSFEFLREIAHLRPRTNTIGAVMRVRNTLAWEIHRFFQERGFLYVHTPIITTGDAEGAGALFRVTTLPPDAPYDPTEDFFGAPAFLTVSGQLEAEAYALAFVNVYTFGPTFRAENSHTPRHLAEFWMVEPEMAFCDLEGDMHLAEEFITHLLEAVLERHPEEMAFFEQWIAPGLTDQLEAVVNTPFTHMTYTEVIEHLKKAPASFTFPPEWGMDLQTEHERYLTEELVKGPVIVTDYPKEIKAFYMKQNPDGRTVRAMDVLVPRLGEIIGGSQREDDYERLLARMQELGMRIEAYQWYLDLRRYGGAPHAGFGLGFDRLVQYVTGMQNIRDVIPFPRTPGNAAF